MKLKELESFFSTFHLVDYSQPLYFSTHAKENGSEASARNAGWKAWRRGGEQRSQRKTLASSSLAIPAEWKYQKTEGCEQSIIHLEQHMATTENCLVF